MGIKQVAAVAILSGLMSSAFAGDWYAVGSVGQSKVQDSGKNEIDAALVAAGVTGLSSTIKDTDTGYKLQLGYKITPNLAVEGGYVDLGKFSYNAAFTGPSAGTANAEIKATGWNFAFVGIVPVNDQWSLFGKLGLIDGKVEETVTASGSGGTATANVSATKWKSNWGVGTTYNVSKAWGVRAEWERFSKLGDNSTTGESDVDLLSVGVVVNF